LGESKEHSEFVIEVKTKKKLSRMQLGFKFEDIFDMLEANLHDETVRKNW
jgi:hypothetical protein